MQKQKKYLVMQKLKSLRIDWRRKRVDKDDDNNNINFSGGNDNDDEGAVEITSHNENLTT